MYLKFSISDFVILLERKSSRSVSIIYCLFCILPTFIGLYQCWRTLILFNYLIIGANTNPTAFAFTNDLIEM